MATEDSLVAFQLQRIYCGLANAPSLDIRRIQRRLHAQPEPGDRIADAAAGRVRSGRGAPIPAGAAPFAVASGQTVSLAANWPADSVEKYPAWDVLPASFAITRKPCGFPGTPPQGLSNTTSPAGANMKPKPSPKIPGRPALQAGAGPYVGRAARQPRRHGFRRLRFRRRALISPITVDGDLLHQAA